MKKEITKQIKRITRLLIEHSISVTQMFPKYDSKTQELVWEGYKNIAFVLKDERYEDMYRACLQERDYNFLLLDGAIIQMKYKFKGKRIISHVLSFYPNPNLERFQDSPDDYEESYYGNELFADIVDRKAVTFPFRIDYDSNSHTDVDHPYVHITLGNYKNCRAPVAYPVSPNRFMLFILRNFYYDKFKEKLTDQDFACELRMDKTISKNEEKLIHLNFV